MYLIVVQAVARSAARCALHVHGHGAKTNACGRSFAVLSTPVSAAGLRLRHKILAWCPSRCPRRHAGTLWRAGRYRGAARCLLHVLGRSIKANACGLSFAILPMQVSAVGLRLGHSRLTCGVMLEVSSDAAAAGEEKLVSFCSGAE
jgi:hypothetical protein